MRYVVCVVAAISLMVCATTAYAKVKTLQKPEKSYDFKAVKLIVVDPMTSYNVDFGKVDEKRLPKIRAILEKTKKNQRKHMVVGAKQAKTNIPFAYEARKSQRKATTLVLRYNFDKFDNGNIATRALSPFGGGKAKVKLTAEFVNAADNKVVAKYSAEAKGSGGIVPGGADAEVLWGATNQANGQIYEKLMKLTGLEYDFWAGMKGGAKTGYESQKDVYKEEKRELKKK